MNEMEKLKEMMVKANEELKDTEKMESFKELRIRITEGILNGEMEPYDAYLQFLHEINKIYPNATKYYGTEHFEGKLRTFMIMNILRKIGGLK